MMKKFFANVALKRYINTLTFAMFLLAPNFVFAATSPQNKILNVINGFFKLLMFLAPTLGGLALIWFGTQYYFAKESHDKSELKKQMFDIGKISVVIAMASTIITWVFSLAK